MLVGTKELIDDGKHRLLYLWVVRSTCMLHILQNELLGLTAAQHEVLFVETYAIMYTVVR